MEYLKVGFANLTKKDQIHIKNLEPKQLGRLVQLSGVIIKVSDIYPEMKASLFQCLKCKH